MEVLSVLQLWQVRLDHATALVDYWSYIAGRSRGAEDRTPKWRIFRRLRLRWEKEYAHRMMWLSLDWQETVIRNLNEVKETLILRGAI